MLKPPQHILSIILFGVLASAATSSVHSKPVPAFTHTEEGLAIHQNFPSQFDFETNSHYSRSTTSYRSYAAPDGSIRSRTKVFVTYPGGSSNTEVQVTIPREALTRPPLRFRPLPLPPPPFAPLSSTPSQTP